MVSLYLQQLTESRVTVQPLGRLPRLKNRAATLFHGRKRAVTPVLVRFLVVFLPAPFFLTATITITGRHHDQSSGG